ncbi:hypothetical protein DOTSEDRAFT_33423 [Dothistroma septosporum NZE10]|uniref:Glycosyl transferase CAP10 domain-containing protein n=1 Tax=Dothistroma septosporum (strain NZE10 / CBS 128990) TaxID=675120 RepID=N1PXE6_DOTSN|nr:hypothetical protein DOTSEDRAFT_33423 [Dothistroma septosporum NZE10]
MANSKLHLLQKDGPNQNFVQVKRDWSDLEQKVRYYFDHPHEAERIISNAIKTFREKALTRAAISCYVRRLIHGYASVASDPVVYKPAKFDGRAKYTRGVGFEQFMDNLNNLMSLLAE